MTKEEQRFQAAAAAMQALLSDLSVFEYDQIAYSAVKMSDALIKELDKHNPSYIDVINAAIKHVEDMGFKPNRFVNIVKIDVNNCIVGCDNAYYYSWYKCTQHNCDNDRIDQGDNYCSECGSKIDWVIEGDETLPAY